MCLTPAIAASQCGQSPWLSGIAASNFLNGLHQPPNAYTPTHVFSHCDNVVLRSSQLTPIIEMSAEIEVGTQNAIDFISERIHEIREHEPEVTVLMEKYQTEGDMVVVDLNSDDDDDFDFLQKYEESL